MKSDSALYAPEQTLHITIGLGWNSKADLDAAVLLFDINENLIDVIFYDKL